MILFLTRKYPPSTGGMETFSFELNKWYPAPHTLVHYGNTQRDVLWAAPALLFAAFKHRKTTTLFHIGDGVLTPLAPLIRLFSSAPIVVTMHALELVHPSRFLSWVIRRSLPFVSRVIAVSDYTKNQLTRYNYPLDRVDVIPHGAEHVRPFESSVEEYTRSKQQAKSALYAGLIDTAVPQTVTEDEWMNATILVTVGRLVKRKGVAWFLEHVFEQVEKTAGTPILYVIIGNGPRYPVIQHIIETRGLQDRVFLLGRVEQQILEFAYSAADIFVMPNIPVTGDAEGFGFVAIEAAAAGLPVVTSDLEGIPSAIHHEKNGYILPPQNAAAYIQTLHNLIQNPDDRFAFGYQASAYTAKHFRWEDVGTRYQQVFNSLVQHSS